MTANAFGFNRAGADWLIYWLEGYLTDSVFAPLFVKDLPSSKERKTHRAAGSSMAILRRTNLSKTILTFLQLGLGK